MALALAVLLIVAVPAAPAAAGGYVKYYRVAAAHDDTPETLTEISLRLLGSGERAGEIYDLNAGRPQPDGASLNDPATLHTGWLLVLPWDAAGPGVRYGTLPETSARPKPSASPPRDATPTASAGPNPSPSTSARCPAGEPVRPGPDWARDRLAAQRAWPSSRGGDQLVAIVDSGVDAAVPQLRGHVRPGTDLVAGPGRRDADCLGTGTAMAAIVAAQPAEDGALAGVAPAATVLPIRVLEAEPTVPAARQAAAIEAAVAARATVIALGRYVDTTDGAVAGAVAAALDHNVVVVVPAPATSDAPTAALGSAAAGAFPAPSAAGTGATGSAEPAALPAEALLRVAGVGADGRQLAGYRAGSVDVLAPGAEVNSLGTGGTGPVTGTGTHLAVAFVAGEAALIRAADPKLSAAEVGHRVRATADPVGPVQVPDPQSGWGIINPSGSVLPPSAAPSASPTPGQAADSVPPAAVTEPVPAGSGRGGDCWPCSCSFPWPVPARTW
ncbi:S8 family serine peptidase [Plantactinospora sp. KBS50]|uniref:S8 family serine peptidase n=1 Tax=Plantactinospora sp. KBS50 TaxID=2024580 RepID=UPI0012FD6995|nr:S8 family serine peptidase [Plantactinospora sp. KBS50]